MNDLNVQSFYGEHETLGELILDVRRGTRIVLHKGLYVMFTANQVESVVRVNRVTGTVLGNHLGHVVVRLQHGFMTTMHWQTTKAGNELEVSR